MVTEATVLGLLLARWAAERWLAHLNRQHVQAHADRIPEAFAEVMDPPTYAKSVRYTLARNRFARFGDSYGTLILVAVLFSGVLPWAFDWTRAHAGESAWAMAAFLVVAGIALALLNLPVDWVEQFRLEHRFGFNTSTQKTWWLDRLKGLLLGVGLGYPLLGFILKIVEWTGALWWLWAWGVFIGFQLLMTVLAPVLILPLFNKLTPLPEGSLKERLTALARRTRFKAQGIQIMDGSRRSRHSNAFFTGFGRFRRIVLFDTLIEQLDEADLESVLAHEIGHYKRHHIHKRLASSAVGTLVGFCAIAWLAREGGFVHAFGFPTTGAGSGFTPGAIAPVLLLFGLLSGVITFWVSPLFHWVSRRHEYEADAFAVEATRTAAPLVRALRKLNEKNLSNLIPHPAYSSFYYSHPTLLEREAALRACSARSSTQRTAAD